MKAKWHSIYFVQLLNRRNIFVGLLLSYGFLWSCCSNFDDTFVKKDNIQLKIPYLRYLKIYIFYMNGNSYISISQQIFYEQYFEKSSKQCLKEQFLLFLMIFPYYFRKHYSKYEKTRRTPKTNDTSCKKHWKHRIGKQIF